MNDQIKQLVKKLEEYANGDEFQRPVEFAIYHLERLSTENEELKREWISVDYRLPEDGRVLVFSPNYPERDSMRVRIMDYQFVSISSEATHWMPLPNPPDIAAQGEVK